MNPYSWDLLQFSSLSCVTWSEKQQKVIQAAEKQVWVLYGTEIKGISKQWWGSLSHPDWHIGCYTSLLWAWPPLSFNNLILKFDIHCSVHCAHPQWLLVLFVWVFTAVALSLFLNPVTLSSLRVSGTQFFFPPWIFHFSHAVTILPT